MEGAGAVFRYVREAATGAWKEPEKGARYFGGFDLAKVEDFTVFVILDKEKQVVAADRFHRVDWSVQVQRIRALAQRHNDAEIGERSEMHHGAVVLDTHGPGPRPESLTWKYWTDRKSVGTMILTGRVDRVFTRYADALAADPSSREAGPRSGGGAR